jgi:hypothetical protein
MSIREEQCNKVCRVLDDVLANRPTERDSLIVATRNAFSALSEPHWIPCSERLPEESGRYLISALDGIGRRTTVAPYQPRYKAWTMTGRMAYWKVVAWQPLPEPYEERRER